MSTDGHVHEWVEVTEMQDPIRRYACTCGDTRTDPRYEVGP